MIGSVIDLLRDARTDNSDFRILSLSLSPISFRLVVSKSRVLLYEVEEEEEEEE